MLPRLLWPKIHGRVGVSVACDRTRGSDRPATEQCKGLAAYNPSEIRGTATASPMVAGVSVLAPHWADVDGPLLLTSCAAWCSCKSALGAALACSNLMLPPCVADRQPATLAIYMVHGRCHGHLPGGRLLTKYPG